MCSDLGSFCERKLAVRWFGLSNRVFELDSGGVRSVSGSTAGRRLVMLCDKISPRHLERNVLLHACGSSAHQVLHNREGSIAQLCRNDEVP